jgi:hypothetical protein
MCVCTRRKGEESWGEREGIVNSAWACVRLSAAQELHAAQNGSHFRWACSNSQCRAGGLTIQHIKPTIVLWTIDKRVSKHARAHT